jgi:hypothetical protein
MGTLFGRVLLAHGFVQQHLAAPGDQRHGTRQAF